MDRGRSFIMMVRTCIFISLVCLKAVVSYAIETSLTDDFSKADIFNSRGIRDVLIQPIGESESQLNTPSVDHELLHQARLKRSPQVGGNTLRITKDLSQAKPLPIYPPRKTKDIPVAEKEFIAYLNGSGNGEDMASFFASTKEVDSKILKKRDSNTTAASRIESKIIPLDNSEAMKAGSYQDPADYAIQALKESGFNVGSNSDPVQDAREAKHFENLGARMGCTDKYCYPELHSLKFQGDILLDDEQRNAIKVKSHLWPRGIIPYSFLPSVSEEDKSTILKAMNNLQSRTCVQFIPRYYHFQYIQIGTDKKGCYASIGYRPLTLGAAPVNFQTPECLYQVGTVEHELLHVLGLFHEQARSDRDDYVNIYWDRIDKQYYSEFGKVDESMATSYNVPYNYKSIMHYPRNAFSIDGQSTIVAKNDTEMELGQRRAAAEGDIKKVNIMYGCKM